MTPPPALTGMATVIPWQPPIETPLASIGGTWNDLFQARRYAHRLLEALRHRGQALRDVELLTIAALTKYCRAFSGGKSGRRLRLAELPVETSHLASLHQYLQHIRDKHIAHPVNRFEVGYVTLCIVDLGTTASRATAVAPATSAIAGLSIEQTEGLIELCEAWLGLLNAEMVPLQRMLLDVAKDMTPAQLNGLSTVPTVEPDLDPRRQR